MRNNTRALIFHILIIFITFAIAALINLSSSMRNLVYGNIFFKVFIIILGNFFQREMQKALIFLQAI